MQRVGEVKVGTHPFGLAIEPDGRRAFIANVISNDVTIVDLATREVTATLPVGTRPYGVAFAGGKVFVANQGSGSVSVFAVAGLSPFATIRVGDYPEGIAATADGSAVYVACWSDNTLVRIDAATLTLTGKAEVGDGPRAFGKFLR